MILHDRPLRSRLLWLMANLERVQAWRQTLPDNELTALNHPNTVWRKLNKKKTARNLEEPPGKPPTNALLKRNAEAKEAEITELKTDLERRKQEITELKSSATLRVSLSLVRSWTFSGPHTRSQCSRRSATCSASK